MQPLSFPQFIFLQPCFSWYQDDYIMQGIFLENSIDKGHPESKDHLHMVLTQVSIQHVVQAWPQVIFTCCQH